MKARWLVQPATRSIVDAKPNQPNSRISNVSLATATSLQAFWTGTPIFRSILITDVPGSSSTMRVTKRPITPKQKKPLFALTVIWSTGRVNKWHYKHLSPRAWIVTGLERLGRSKRSTIMVSKYSRKRSSSSHFPDWTLRHCAAKMSTLVAGPPLRKAAN